MEFDRAPGPSLYGAKPQSTMRRGSAGTLLVERTSPPSVKRSPWRWVHNLINDHPTIGTLNWFEYQSKWSYNVTGALPAFVSDC